MDELNDLSLRELLQLLRLLACYEHYDHRGTPAPVQKWWDNGVTADLVEDFIWNKCT